MTPPAFLQGSQLHLRALCEADCNGPYLQWLNDPEVCRANSHHLFPYSLEAATAYVRGVRDTRDALVLAIVRNADGRHVGNIALQNLHAQYRSAEFAILIGDPTARGQGYGKEAGLLLCDHGFWSLNLNRIHCGTFATNDAMIRLAASLGMREEGRRRQAAFKDGRPLDVIEFGVLRSEYDTLRKRS